MVNSSNFDNRNISSMESNEAPIAKAVDAEQQSPNDFSVNVINLSFDPPRRLMSQTISLVKDTLAPLKLGRLFPKAFQDLGTSKRAVPLRNVNFKAENGTITAILGEKDERRQVVDLMAGRIRSGLFDGDICMRGKSVTSSSRYYDNVAYVQRKPLYISGLTYIEMLRYSAKLKMKSKYSMGGNAAKVVEDRLLDLINLMNLNKCRNRVIPEYPATRGEIGCDLRRLSIALEIVDLPPLIVMDEPTQHFDPFMSAVLMKCLQNLAKRGHCLVVSMRKPYHQEFLCLDNVVLLANGYSIYAGPTGQLREYLCSPTMGYELKDGVDLVDFVMDVLSGVERPTSSRAPEAPSLLQHKFEESSYYDAPSSITTGDSNAVTAFSREFFAFWGYLTFDTPAHIIYRADVVIRRAIDTKIKDTEAIQAGIMGCSLIAVICGYLQFDQGSYGSYALSLLGLPYLNTTNLASLFFFSSAFAFAFPITNAHIICQKMKLFRYEQAAGCCTVAAMFLASVISEVPFLMVYMLSFANIVYWMANLGRGLHNYFYYLHIVMLVSFVGLTSAYLLCTILQKELIVKEFFFLILSFLVFLSGFPFQLSSMTSYLSDASTVNPLRWSFESLMKWKFDKYYDGQTWLAPYGFDTFDIYSAMDIFTNFIVIANCVTILFMFAAPLTLKRKVYKSRISSTASGNDSIHSVDSIDLGNLSTDRTSKPQKRKLEPVKPVLFMREPSVTGRGSKLSVNLSHAGEENSDHGPTVLFTGLNYRVVDPKSPLGFKTILNEVSGQFDWGKLSVIMGAPDSGKSSLLQILAGEAGIGTELQGEVMYNGRIPDPNMPLWQRCGFVALQAEHHRDLTVREVLRYAMMLRCVNHLGLTVLEENVTKTMEILHLESIASTKARKCTPGELKRLSIAEEMVHGPKLLLIDEPTTGVNLEESAVLLSTFREMVNQDRTVVATVHQPTAEIFKLFDTLLLLSKGRVIYYGSVRESANFFINSPYKYSFDIYNNPADFLVDVSGGVLPDCQGDVIDASILEGYYKQSKAYDALQLRIRTKQAQNQALSKSGLTDSLAQNPLYGKPKSRMGGGNMIDDDDSDMQDGKGAAASEAQPNTASMIGRTTPVNKPTHRTQAIVVAFFTVLRPYLAIPTVADWRNLYFKGGIIFQRSVMALANRWQLIIASIILHILLACMFGWIIGEATGMDGVYDVTSFLAISSMFLILSNIQFVFYIYNNHQVFLREHSRGLYSNIAQWLFSSWPLYLLKFVDAIIFVLVIYPILDLDQTASIFGFVVLMFMFLVLTSAILSEILVFVAAEMRQAYVSIPGFAFLNFIFSGLFIKPGSLPLWLAPWTPSMSMIRWNMQGCFIGIYENSDVFTTTPSGYSTYQAFLSLFGWGGKTKWYCFYMLLANVAVYRAVSLFASGLSTIVQRGGGKHKKILFNDY